VLAGAASNESSIKFGRPNIEFSGTPFVYLWSVGIPSSMISACSHAVIFQRFSV
jgi:hypothetical protein